MKENNLFSLECPPMGKLKDLPNRNYLYVTVKMNNAHIHHQFVSSIVTSLTSTKLHRVQINAEFGPTCLKVEWLLQKQL